MSEVQHQAQPFRYLFTRKPSNLPQKQITQKRKDSDRPLPKRKESDNPNNLMLEIKREGLVNVNTLKMFGSQPQENPLTEAQGREIIHHLQDIKTILRANQAKHQITQQLSPIESTSITSKQLIFTAATNSLAVYGKSYANPQDVLYPKGFENSSDYNYKIDGMGGTLDKMFRDQFCNRDIIIKSTRFSLGIVLVCTILCVMLRVPGSGDIYSIEGWVDFLYGGLVITPVVIWLRFLSHFSCRKAEEKYRFGGGDQRDNYLYDPEGEIYSDKVMNSYSIQQGSFSLFLMRTPQAAWKFIFISIFDFLSDVIRAFCYPTGSDWRGNVRELPAINDYEKWIFFSFCKAAGMILVVLTTHWYGRFHWYFAAVAMAGGILQTKCVDMIHDDLFWNVYYRTAEASLIIFTVSLVASPYLKQRPSWPVEWLFVFLISVICHNEIAAHWIYGTIHDYFGLMYASSGAAEGAGEA